MELKGIPKFLCPIVPVGDADCSGQKEAQRTRLAGQAGKVYRFSLFLL